jgi:hypothetical protein
MHLSMILLLNSLLMTGFNTTSYTETPITEATSVSDGIEDFFLATDNFLQLYVKKGMVDYEGIRKDKEKIRKLSDMIASADLSGKGKSVKTAFYINAYNILTIRNVVENMPISSPLDVKGFFDTRKFTVAGKELTLNEIENNYLRPDPRVHFVLVCAAKGCPTLMSSAYRPGNIQDMLDRQTRKALNDPDFIRVKGDKVQVSEIFKWYAEDFKQHSGSVKAYIESYRDTPLPGKAEVGYYTYDWSLNKQ